MGYRVGLIMKNRILFVLFIIGVLSLLTSHIFRKDDTVLEFRLQDSISKSMVWDAEITFQNKVINTFFQIEEGEKTYVLTNLEKGDWELVVKSPYYQTEKIVVSLKSGKNQIDNPISMKGLEIPGLDRFIIVENKIETDLLAELRAIDIDGNSIKNHPALNIAVLVQISEQKGKGKDYSRGNRLYYDIAPWTWNNSFNKAYRYEIKIPLSRIDNNKFKLMIIDYLIIVPNPLNLSEKRFNQILADVKEFDTVEKVFSHLDSFKDQLNYYITTSKDVNGESK